MMRSIKLLTIVEATTVNAVAKTVLEFYRAARELSEKSTDFPGVEGCVATFDRSAGKAPPNEFVSSAREQGLEVEVIPERRRFDMRVIPALRRLFESRGSDLLITNSVKSHFLVWRSGLWRKHPWIAFHHGYTDTDRKMRLYNRLDRWSLPHADRVVTVCQAFARELSTSTGVSLAKISVQHNSVRRQPPLSATVVADFRTRLGISEKQQVLLAVGRLSREKGHLDLFAAFNRLCEIKPASLKLIIVGDGPERARLEATAASLGVKESILFTGQVNDVQPFYAIADVFVLPSHSEGSPNVLLEAMAANLPVVATAVGGVPEVVEHNQSALLVPAHDPPALAAAISEMLTDAALRKNLVTNAATLVETRFTPDHYAQSLVEIYREVIEGWRA